MSQRNAEQIGLLLVAPFWILGCVLFGVIAGIWEGGLMAWQDIRREWYV